MSLVKIIYKDINNVFREVTVESTLKELDLSSKGIVSHQPNCFIELPELEILW